MEVCVVEVQGARGCVQPNPTETYTRIGISIVRDLQEDLSPHGTITPYKDLTSTYFQPSHSRKISRIIPQALICFTPVHTFCGQVVPTCFTPVHTFCGQVVPTCFTPVHTFCGQVVPTVQRHRVAGGRVEVEGGLEDRPSREGDQPTAKDTRPEVGSVR